MSKKDLNFDKGEEVIYLLKDFMAFVVHEAEQNAIKNLLSEHLFDFQCTFQDIRNGKSERESQIRAKIMI